MDEDKRTSYFVLRYELKDRDCVLCGRRWKMEDGR